MTTIKGMYENSEIKLLEAAPTMASKVLITFVEDEHDDIRTISLQQKNTAINEYLDDDREDLYQDYLKK